jgi:hypothetical protein
MIPSQKPTEPQYSIGKSLRKPLSEDIRTPGPIYSQTTYSNLKFPKNPSWKIGKEKRHPLYSNEIFPYYNMLYKEENDFGKLKKNWNKIIGGAIDLETRIKYDFKMKSPGPGRYDPNYEKNSNVKKNPSYVLGLKSNKNSLIIDNGSGINVAPWTYNQDKIEKLSQHKKFPCYSFQQSLRKDLSHKNFSKNESYFNYSAFGEQIMTKKPTMPRESFTKSTREGRMKCGVFKYMMERSPSSINLGMPKF